MIASLPMYDRPENASAHDVLWALIRDALRAEGVPAPEALNREVGIWDGWQSPDLVVGQICGLPLRAKLHDRVELIATADYGLPNTPAGHYRSVFVVRQNDSENIADYADKIFAYNEENSQSGWASPQSFAQDLGFQFQNIHKTGAHRQSAIDVAAGVADIAALDAISWRHIAAHDLAAKKLNVIGHTQATPGLAFIAAKGTDTRPHLRAVTSAIAALPNDARLTLGVRGVARIPLSAYLAVPTPPAASASPV